MSNEQIADYIRRAREAGMEDNEIRQNLLGSGFSAMEIEEELSIFGKIGIGAVSPAKKRFSFRFGKPLMIIVVIIALVIGGYFILDRFFPQYAKYVQPYLGPVLDPVVDSINSITSNLPFIGGAPYNPDDILKAFEKTVLIDSAKYKASLYVETQDKDANLRPLVVKIPQGEIPDDLKKAITSYSYPYNGVKAGEADSKDAVIVDLKELKPAMDAKARDRAKLQLISSILTELGSYYNKSQRDPTSISELISVNTSFGTYTSNIANWAALEGKYFNYSVSPDLKSFKLAITLESKQSIEGLKKTIETFKKLSYYGSKFNEGSIVFEGDKVIFNERAVSFAYNLSYGSLGAQSIAEQMASLFSDGSYGGYLSYIPGRFKLNLDVGGIMQSKDSKSFYIQLGGKADFEDLVVEADFEFTNVDKESFFRINKFPSIFMDVSKVREEWIKLPVASKSSGSGYPDADHYSSYAGSIQENITEYREKSDRQFAQFRKLASVAEEEKIITAVGAPSKEKVGDRTAYKYLVTIDENKLASFYGKAAAALKEYGNEALIQENELTKLFFNSNGLKEIIKYLKDASDFYVWVDANGYIVKYQYELKYVPYVASGSQKAQNKQFYISSSVELSDINKNLNIEKPGKYIEWEEAVTKLFGVVAEQLSEAREKSRNAKRIADVNQIRTAAELYFDDNGGSYPKEISMTTLGDYLSVMPKDPSTDQPYNYAYYPADKPTKFQVWASLESGYTSALTADADINSTGWVGSTVNASPSSTESCSADFNNGTARDCIYDIGQK